MNVKTAEKGSTREQGRTETLRERLISYPAFNELSESGKQETIDILLKLANGQSISSTRVNSMELFVNAFSRRGELNETININTAQREHLRKEVRNKIEKLGSAVENNGKIEYNGIVKREFRADIVIGLPSVGKSSVLVDPLSALFKSRIIDSDMVKELLPEFENGLGAGNVHQESKKINDEIFKNACKNGENIVLPIVGSEVKKVLKILNSLKGIGYDVYLHLNELPMYKALGRMITRYIEKGRFLTPDLIYDYQNKPAEVFEYIINEERGLLSGYSRYSNDVEYGERPIFKSGTKDFYSAFTRGYRKDIKPRSGVVQESGGRVSNISKVQNSLNSKTDFLIMIFVTACTGILVIRIHGMKPVILPPTGSGLTFPDGMKERRAVIEWYV